MNSIIEYYTWLHNTIKERRVRRAAVEMAKAQIAFMNMLDDREEKLSNCCGARLSTLNPDNVTGVCGKCREHCAVVSAK